MTEREETASRNGQSVANIERRLREEILTGGIPAGSVTSQAARSQMELALVMHQRGVPATIVGTELKRAVDWAEQARRDC